MIEFKKQGGIYVQVNTKNRDYLRSVEERLTAHKKGYFFSPAYKSGGWDGRISVFQKAGRRFPFGLFLDVLRHTKKEWPELEYTIDKEIKLMFNGISLPKDYKWGLSLTPYDYQEEVIRASLQTSKGIVVSATASGKSLMIAYILKALHQFHQIANCIIIVPSLSLIEQFYTDLQEYGINAKLIGKVNKDHKQFNKPFVISTWQSLKNNADKMNMYQAVVVDEVHGAKAVVLKDLLKECYAKWRFGLTGTMPNDPLEELNVKSFLGPVIKEFGSRDLAERGYVAKCVVKMIRLVYQEEIVGDYPTIRDKVFMNNYRLGLLKHIIHNSNHSVLCLVEKVEKEGQVIEQALMESGELKNREIVFLSGKDDAMTREAWRRLADGNDNVIIVATYGIFQQGINIKSLRSLILAAPSKSKIRVLQSIGRILRLHADKVNGAIVWDIVDDTKYLSNHGEKRFRFYQKERHPVEEYKLVENKDITYELIKENE